LELEGAYIRRQKWIAKLQAVEIVNTLGTALSGKGTESGGNSAKPYRETSLEGLMGIMGTSWR